VNVNTTRDCGISSLGGNGFNSPGTRAIESVGTA
jgi:hypothetical protein